MGGHGPSSSVQCDSVLRLQVVQPGLCADVLDPQAPPQHGHHRPAAGPGSPDS